AADLVRAVQRGRARGVADQGARRDDAVAALADRAARSQRGRAAATGDAAVDGQRARRGGEAGGAAAAAHRASHRQRLRVAEAEAVRREVVQVRDRVGAAQRRRAAGTADQRAGGDGAATAFVDRTAGTQRGAAGAAVHAAVDAEAVLPA